MKKCSRCLEVKPLDCFYKKKRMSDGHINQCKQCCSEERRDNRLRNIEHFRAYDRVRGNRRSAERRKKWQEVNMSKYQAQILIHNLIRAEKLIRQSCEICGKEKTHAHHDDYLKPFAIRWLCALHHSQWHKINGEGKNGKVNLKDFNIKSINDMAYD